MMSWSSVTLLTLLVVGISRGGAFPGSIQLPTFTVDTQAQRYPDVDDEQHISNMDSLNTTVISLNTTVISLNTTVISLMSKLTKMEDNQLQVSDSVESLKTQLAQTNERMDELQNALFAQQPSTQTSTVSTVVPCPIDNGYILVESPRLCFKLSSDQLPYTDSEEECKKEGGRLGILDTADKRDYIRGTGWYGWVGMTLVNGAYQWSDGSSYTEDWQQGEPDNDGCATLSKWGLGDSACYKDRRRLCEIVV